MKKNYTAPELEISCFLFSDVATNGSNEYGDNPDFPIGDLG